MSMEDFIKLLQLTVAISVYYVWIFRFHNVLKEFKSFGLNDITRNLVGASKMALSTLLIVGVWYPTFVFIYSLLMGGFMISAQFFHFKNICENSFFKLSRIKSFDFFEDELINVLDIVLLVNLVLSGTYNEFGDLNSDSILNVLDIVSLVNMILGAEN